MMTDPEQPTPKDDDRQREGAEGTDANRAETPESGAGYGNHAPDNDDNEG